MKKFNVEKLVLEINAFDSFNPMQAKALKNGLLNTSVIVSSPTASGKTILAELSALNSILNLGKKVIYTCPLKALAVEHYEDFKSKYSKELNIKMILSIGDFDSKSSFLGNFDLIFTTYEKVESLLRHKADWLNSLGTLIVDEIHEIDSDRGPTLEMIITKLCLMNSNLQLIGLSATVPNAKELSNWLKAKLVESDYRPVPLKEGVYFSGQIDYGKEKESIQLQASSPLEELVLNAINKNQQSLVFANSRQNAESIARKLSGKVFKTLTEKEKIFLKKSAEEVLNVLENPTEQCKKLYYCIQHGTCFHTAGLVQKQRTLIEELFRKGKLKVLSSTPTLAAGVNLPAENVFIPSIYRYSGFGMQPIPVREYKQQAGRAGRPKYAKEAGKAILIAKNELEKVELFENFIHGEIEKITSKMSLQPVLRMHLLSLIATNFIFDLKSMKDFFEKTFYAYQYKNSKNLFENLLNLLRELEEMKFIETNSNEFKATVLGKRVAELFIDPITAHNFVQILKQKRIGTELSYLFLVCDCFELSPFPRVPSTKKSLLWTELIELKKELFVDLDKKIYEDNEIIEKYLLTKIFQSWINEIPEQILLKEYGMRPGILHAKNQKIDWLLYALIELEKVFKSKTHFKPLTDLRQRIKYGIRAELLELVQLKGIGRVRARMLFNNGIKGIADLKKVELTKLAQILGQKIALNVKHQLGLNKNVKQTEFAKKILPIMNKQKNLNNF